MPRADIEFKTHDGVTLRGWFITPNQSGGKIPCLVMCHGWSAVKEMDLDAFAEHFVSKLAVSCLVYDHRGFGASDVAPGQPRLEIIPNLQISDIQDAITYAQSRDEVDAEKIGVWGSSYSGAHMLQVASMDKRVKAVISQVPLVDGKENFRRLVRSDFQPSMYQLFQQDRLDRMAGKAPATVPVVAEDPTKPAALPTPDSYQFFTKWESKCSWKNENTVRSLEYLTSYYPTHQIENISPAPLLMVVGERDVLTPTDLALKAYARALEPKQLLILPGAGHFDAYTGKLFEHNAGTQAEFLKKTLCA